jgi:hypothetical protein
VSDRRESSSEVEPPAGRPAQGPDPVWGIGVFIVGLVTMATGGAKTWHWVFNVGEAVMLIGIATFLVVIAINAVREEPLRLRDRLPAWLGGRHDDD